MIKREISNIAIFLISILLVFISIFIRFYHLENLDRIIQKKENLQILIEGAQKIERIWNEGDIRGNLRNKRIDCSKEFNSVKGVDATFFRCNIGFLECILRESQKKEITGFPKNIYPIKLEDGDNFTKIITRSNFEGPKVPSFGVLIHIGRDRDSLKIILSDSCRETLIPQRVYSYGMEHNDWRWDNLNRFIMIDKSLVTNFDVFNFKPQLVKEKNSQPATQLKLEDMQKFCLSRGKQLVQAHIFDAATYLPGNLKNKIPKKIFKSPYPWTRIRTDSFLYSAQRYADFVFENKYCSRAYTSECLGKVSFNEFQFRTTTWLGLSEVIGGPMEVMRNPINIRENLFASSFHFSASSMQHQLGNRGYWDGINFSWDHVELSEKPSGDYAQIGFRCMRVIQNAL